MSGVWGRGRGRGQPANRTSSSQSFPALGSDILETKPGPSIRPKSTANAWEKGAPLIVERMKKKVAPPTQITSPGLNEASREVPTTVTEAEPLKPQEPRPPLTEVEQQILRDKRRLKRENKKIQKRLDKENAQRMKLYLPQSSKISIVSPQTPKSKPNVTLSQPILKSSDSRIRFQHDEFPTIGDPETVISKVAHDTNTGAILTDAESGSEWETEVEDVIEAEGADPIGLDEMSAEKIEIISAPVSYSSILKKTRSEPGVSQEPHKMKVKPNPPTVTSIVAKKVKRKDPITFDLSQALSVKKPQPKKVFARVVAKPTFKPRNPLDSTAPTQNRGKQREKPKKKRMTKMRQIILEERARRRLDRLTTTGSRIPSIIQQPIDLVPKVMANELKDIDSAEDRGVAEGILVASGKAQALIEPASSDNAPNTNVAAQFERFAEKQRSKLHSRKFREYCNHTLNSEIDAQVRALLKDLVRFQDRQFFKDPNNAKTKRRYVVGLREVRKFLQVKKIVLLLIAPDVEPVKNEGGLNDMISNLMELAEASHIPVVFTLNRWKLGKACARKVAVSAIGIISYEGCNEVAKSIIQLVGEQKKEYDQMLENALRVCDTVPESAAPIEPMVLNEEERIRQEFMTKIRELALG